MYKKLISYFFVLKDKLALLIMEFSAQGYLVSDDNEELVKNIKSISDVKRIYLHITDSDYIKKIRNIIKSWKNPNMVIPVYTSKRGGIILKIKVGKFIYHMGTNMKMMERDQWLGKIYNVNIQIKKYVVQSNEKDVFGIEFLLENIDLLI